MYLFYLKYPLYRAIFVLILLMVIANGVSNLTFLKSAQRSGTMARLYAAGVSSNPDAGLDFTSNTYTIFFYPYNNIKIIYF